jgi:hypothetical protein
MQRLTTQMNICHDALRMVRNMSENGRRLAALAAIAGAFLLAACDDGPSSEPVFPENPETIWTELRDCRNSHEHELRFIRVFASPDAEEPYLALSPDVPYPVGATLVKLEYDDASCTNLIGYTALEKLPAGTQPAANDWLWQRVNADRRVLEEGAMYRCINCHTEHCSPPHGYDLTCAEEL